MGGPDSLDAVRPFLRNLFRDPAIIGAPGLIREGLAWFISTVRFKEAQENYSKMGGASPLLPETLKQADALKERLKFKLPEHEVRVFTAMRYWHPFISKVVSDVEDWSPEETVL